MADRSANRKRKASSSSILDVLNADDVEVATTDAQVFNNAQIKCKIFVKTPTGEIISLLVRSSDTIGSIKRMIQTQECIPFDEQELILNGIVLDDMNTVGNLPINNSTLILVLKSFINIFIKNMEGRIIYSFDVKPTDTIASLKAKIMSKEGISIGEQVLIFNKMVLGDDGTLFDFHIKSKAVLTLIHRSKGVFMRIILETLTNHTFMKELKPSCTIGSIKAKMQDLINISSDEQELIYNGIVLHNMNTLADYNIKTESTITINHSSGLMHSSRGLVKIFLKPPSGMTFNLDVKLSDTIYSIKAKIQDNAHIHKVNIPCNKQELIFNEMVLHNTSTLADYNIKWGSTLTLVPISRGVMQIFVKIPTGKTITLEVKLSDTIRAVKAEIFNKEGYPASEIDL